MAELLPDAEMKTRLLGYLDHLESGISRGGDFVLAQAPDVAREIVAYNLAYSAFALTVTAVVMAGTGWLLAKCIRKVASLESDSDVDGRFILSCLGLLVFGITDIICLVRFMINADVLIQCWSAPKFFVLQQIAELIKTHQ